MVLKHELGIVLVLVAVALGVPQLRNALTRAWRDQGREIVTNLTTLVRTPRRLGAAVKTPPPANSAVRHFLSFLKRQYPAEPADNE